MGDDIVLHVSDETDMVTGVEMGVIERVTQEKGRNKANARVRDVEHGSWSQGCTQLKDGSSVDVLQHLSVT